MVSTHTNADTAAQTVTPAAAPPAGSLLISLAALPQDALEATLANLALAFPSQTVLVATPGAAPSLSSGGPLRLFPYTPAAPSTIPWILAAADYVNTFRIAQDNEASACLVLGAESQSFSPEAIRSLAAATLTADLSVARYNLGPREGLVNSAILYPVTRALFCTTPRFPLAIDLGLSMRMASHLAAVAQRFTAASQNDALLWPVAEAATANYLIAEVDIPSRTFPTPASANFNSMLAQVAGSLFTEVETKAPFWQRARPVQPPRPLPNGTAPPEDASDIAPMIESFQIAYTNLLDIWSLVLPPHSLLGLKKLSLSSRDTFRMPDDLWSRIVYDFILAFRLRTINRGHLLGALTPLYLAWVASHLLLSSTGTGPEPHIEDQAVAFESAKPYLVSRWRWPDRFNP